MTCCTKQIAGLVNDMMFKVGAGGVWPIWVASIASNWCYLCGCSRAGCVQSSCGCPNYWFCRKLCQFCGSAVLSLLFCGSSGSSWLVSLEMISARDVLGGILSVVLSNRSATCFVQCFGENFAEFVGVRCWFWCVVGFLDQMCRFHCQQYPLGMVWVRLCRSSFSNRSVTWQFCQITWGCSIAQVCARVAYCLGSP